LNEWISFCLCQKKIQISGINKSDICKKERVIIASKKL
jgi:hypothetical protein